MLRFLAWVFPSVADLQTVADMRLERVKVWEGRAIDRLNRIHGLEIDLDATRKARDGQIWLNLELEAAVTNWKVCNDQQAESIGGLTASLKQAEADLAKFRELWEAASTRAVAAEREAAFYRGIVGNVRRALSYNHCMENADLQKEAETRAHPEQRASNGPRTAWDSASLAKAGLYQHPPGKGGDAPTPAAAP